MKHRGSHPKMKIKTITFHTVLLTLFLVCRLCLAGDHHGSQVILPDTIDFNFHIKPILADRCYKCHGPDDNAREAEMRLDQKDGAFGDLGDGYFPIVPGKPEESEIIWHIFSDDEDDLMPPPDSGYSLTVSEKETIKKWIEQGAEWKDHWAFVPPQVRPSSLAELQKKELSNGKGENRIDHFIVQKLQEHELSPSSEADKEHLIRRLSFDLTGLPPDLEHIDTFVTDDSPVAYERLVDRLLATDAHAERMAMEWMDVARYGDTQGMHADRERFHWPWRDWVIKAFKENLAYDEFITWQLAGDLLPNATTEQKLATAFHRNHPVSAEGGIVDEEFRVKYVQDRTNTTATAFMGLTMECATCHDHKFDPVTQKEYYQLFAFFNNQMEIGMVAEGGGSSGPVLLLPEPDAEKPLTELSQEIDRTLRQLESTVSRIVAEKNFIETAKSQIVQAPSAYAFFPFDCVLPKKIEVEGYIHRVVRNTPIDKIVDDNPVSVASGEPRIVNGRIGNALEFDKEYDLVFLRDTGTFEMNEPFSAGAWIRTDKEGVNQSIMGISGDLTNQAWRGWDLFLDTQNRPSIRFISFWPHNYMQITADISIPTASWHHILFTYDGSGRADGMNLYINGKKQNCFTDYDHLYRTIVHPWKEQEGWKQKPVMVGRSGRFYTGDNGVFSGSIDHLKLFNRYLTTREVAALYHDETETPVNPDIFTDEDYVDHYLNHDDPGAQYLIKKLQDLTGRKLKLLEDVPEIMVMEEMPETRKTFVLDRGQYNAPTDEVTPGTPEKVLPFRDEWPRNRLGLAHWLVDQQNPLTARVAVNRYWQMIFGRGIVDTPEDFGIQGALPSHPELLDWLAVYFMESGWNVRDLLRTMVTSNTYRQTSATTKDHWEKDPGNIYLARGASDRLPAEMIRDNALKASGLLIQKVGGPSVKPYQPEGIWMKPSESDYKQDSGESLYRRSLYTYIRRSTPHPAMLAFDAPSRSVCVVKREKTNTPLQALVLLNDPQFVESARVLAQRMQFEGGESVESQVRYGFRLLCGRSPDSNEIRLLKKQYEIALDKYKSDPVAADEILCLGAYPFDYRLDRFQTAALTMVASTVMNFDGAYMKR